MKFRKNWKRFWTLDRHHAEGFTLVELIVVIAILAILAGVGTVGYSGYVKKANIAADEALIAEVKNALNLAYYSNDLTKSGYVILSDKSPLYNDDIEVEKALQAAFGTSLDNLKLKYDGWNASSALGAYAASVSGSTYIDKVGTDTLLKDVQNCASKLAEFMAGTDKWNGAGAVTILDGLLESGTAVSDMLGNYEDGEIDATVLANATVFGIAYTLNNDTSSAEVIEGFANSGSGYIMNNSYSSLADVAHKYASLEALVGYLQCEAATQILNDFNTNGMNSKDANAIIANLNSACADVISAIGSDEAAANRYLVYYGKTLDTDGNMIEDPNVTKSPARQDGEAYVSIMQTVDGLSGDYSSSLGNSNMFTSNTISNDVNAYVALAKLMTEVGSSSAVAISFSIENGKIVFNIFQ